MLCEAYPLSNGVSQMKNAALVVLIALVGLGLGFGAGFQVGRGQQPKPTCLEQLARQNTARDSVRVLKPAFDECQGYFTQDQLNMLSANASEERQAEVDSVLAAMPPDARKIALIKTDIRNYMTVQEAFFSDYARYGMGDELEGPRRFVGLAPGNEITSSRGVASGYSVTVANMSISGTPNSCQVIVGMGAEITIDGVIRCP